MLVLESLKKTVTQALDRKKRLGQYTVMWQDEQATIIGGDKPETTIQSD